MSGRFVRALEGVSDGPPPIWLMRQAGRYHSAYRRLREQHDFETLCRVPELAAEVALGPIRDFDFDAAILFSDLLFPLEALGLPLSYTEAGPRLGDAITEREIGQFRSLDDVMQRLQFQRDAVAATRTALARDKGLIGFVGGPWTLFVYAVEGTHAGPLVRAKSCPSLYARFAERIVPVLTRAIEAQLDAGADLVMVLDTAAGEVSPQWFADLLSADLERLACARPGRVGYYAKGLHPAHLSAEDFRSAPWAGIGYDWRWNLADLLRSSGTSRAAPFVQGNFDPTLLFLAEGALEQAMRAYLDPLTRLPAEARRRWICGLGHGVLPKTPEASVRSFVRMVREAFA